MKPQKSTHHPVIPMPDYVRIFRVMRAVMGSTAVDSDEACLFMSMSGAAILKHFYKKDARVLAGSAFYLLDAEPRTVLAMTKSAGNAMNNSIGENDGVESDRTGFHCWLECDDYVIDFQALVFSEAMTRRKSRVRVPRQMFQRRKTAMSASPDALESAGDFYLQPNIALTNELVRAFFGSAAQLDLMRGCMTWFTRPPRKISNAMTIRRNGSSGGVEGNDEGKGETYEMQLGDIEVTGAW
jgi:hypothetical protein